MEKGRKTKAPHAFCSSGNEMPIMKLHVHEARLPIDMATERGATSNSSANWRAQIESVRGLKITHPSNYKVSGSGNVPDGRKQKCCEPLNPI